MLYHDDWHTLGVANIERRQTWIDGVELRLRRSAATLARLDPGESGLLQGCAGFEVACANDLSRFAAHLDERLPGWRDDPGFYPADQDEEPPMES